MPQDRRTRQGPRSFGFFMCLVLQAFPVPPQRERDSNIAGDWSCSLKVPHLKAQHKLPGVPKNPNKKTDSISTLLDFEIKVKDVEQLKNDSQTGDGAGKVKEGAQGKGMASE
ncbi:hypothetical protein CF326_g4150 [Tilletia indica]|nr:hypothetical protein CF326_g4150 [Tilletia indica]